MKTASGGSAIPFLAIIAFVLISIIGLYVIPIKLPHHMCLGRLSQSPQDVSLRLPKGDHYEFVIGLPRVEREGDMHVRGKMTFLLGTNKFGELGFDTATCQTGNWLHAEGLSAYIITSKGDGKTLKSLTSHLAPGAAVRVNIEACGTNVDSASLWLFYLEGWMRHQVSKMEKGH